VVHWASVSCTPFFTRPVLSRLAPALVAVAALPALTLSAQPGFSRADGERFERKLAEIARRAEVRPNAKGTGGETRVTENEVNAYFAYQGRPQLPAGIVDPRVSILGDGRLAGRALVDLNAVREQRSSGGWLDPTSYLAGQLPVSATGSLRTRDGVAWLEIDTVQVAGVTVPNRLLQDLVSYYSRTSDLPQGVNLADPFSLPAGIREIIVRRGEAVIVQ